MHVLKVKKILHNISQPFIHSNSIYHIYYFVLQGWNFNDFCIIISDSVLDVS